MNFSDVKYSLSSERLNVERWIELRLGRSLFTSLSAFILPLNEFVCRSLEIKNIDIYKYIIESDMHQASETEGYHDSLQVKDTFFKEFKLYETSL